MSREELEVEVVRLRHLRHLDKQISEEAEEKARTLRHEEEICGRELEDLYRRLEKELIGSEAAASLLIRYRAVLDKLLHRTRKG